MSSERTVRVRGSDAEFPILVFESLNFGNAKLSTSAVETKNADLKISVPFYPKDLSFVVNVINNADYIEVFLLDANGNPVKQLGSTHYLASTTDSIEFADIRENIPLGVFPKDHTLRIVFHNTSGTTYTFVSAWDCWIPSGFA